MLKGQKKRDTARIDGLIKEFYPTKGPDYVAGLTGEERSYIISRANVKKIRMVKKSPVKKSAVPSKEELIKKNRVLEQRNKALRLENIKLIANRRMYE